MVLSMRVHGALYKHQLVTPRVSITGLEAGPSASRPLLLVRLVLFQHHSWFSATPVLRKKEFDMML